MGSMTLPIFFTMSVQEIQHIAENFFGDENVDMQYRDNGYHLLIHWSEFQIEDSDGNKHDMYDLYADVILTVNGSYIGMNMLRSTLTEIEANRGYIHSHLPSAHHKIDWAQPCFGTGPIRQTITSLTRGCSEDIWSLFFLELDRYIKVESSYTAPYVRFISLSNTSEGRQPYRIDVRINNEQSLYSQAFTGWLLAGDKIKIYERDGVASLGPQIALIRNLTLLLDEYMHEINVIDKEMFVKIAYEDGTVFILSDKYGYAGVEDMVEFTFKGREVPLVIKRSGNPADNDMFAIKPDLAGEVVSIIYRNFYLNQIETNGISRY